MNKRSQIALAFAASYLLLNTGIAIYRHPVDAVVVFAILTVFSVIGGASASDVVHAVFSFAVIIELVFIIGLVCEGRWVAAVLWLIALLICIAILRGLTDYVAAIAASGYLTDYHWWFARRHGWVPSPALIAFNLLMVATAIINNVLFPPRLDDQKRETASGPDQRSREEQEHTAHEAKREAVDRFEPSIDPPVSADELGKRVGELEGEVRALRASVSRLQNAGKTVIAQREEWKARALEGDNLLSLRSMPESIEVDVCITSPPYFQKFDYQNKGQHGLESSVEEYLQVQVSVFHEVQRLLHEGGTCFIVIGDTSNNYSPIRAKGQRKGGDKQWLMRRSLERNYRQKETLNVPFRLAEALRRDGWVHRSTLIWDKTGRSAVANSDATPECHAAQAIRN